MFRPTLLPAISHGITDIVDYPAESMVAYSIITPIVYQFPIEIKTGLLLGASIYHLRQDIPGGIVGNVLMHMAWIKSLYWLKCIYRLYIHHDIIQEQ